MNIPNILTVIRFIMIPIFGYFLFNEYYLIGVILFILAGITDVFDGVIARKFNMVTSWGKLADPLADKLMQITALIILTVNQLIPIPIIIIVIAKEVFMGIGSILLYKKENVVVSANWYGKMSTVIFYFAIVMAILFKIEKLKAPYTDTIVNVFMLVAVLATLFAFLMYSLTYKSIRKETKQ